MKKQLEIIFVDDSKDFGTLLTHSLNEREDCETHYFSKANEVLGHVARHPQGKKRWIFLDISMPGMSGLELLNILKLESHVDDRFCVISNCNDDAVIKECFELGIVDYILKNRCRDELINRINHLIDSDVTSTPLYVEVFEIKEVVHDYKVIEKHRESIILETPNEMPIHSIINLPASGKDQLYKVQRCELVDHGAVVTCHLLKNCA